MDSTQYLFLDISSVKRLISERDKHDGYRIDELVTAIMLCSFCEKFWNTKCAIGFPLKNSGVNTIPLVGDSDIIGLKKILNMQIEQAHDVDVLIIKNNIGQSAKEGQGFQIKHFNTYQSNLTTEGLIEFIEALVYQKTETALVILLATGEPTRFTEIRNSLDFSKFPFSALYFLGVYGEALRFVEVWPNLGKEEIEWSII